MRKVLAFLLLAGVATPVLAAGAPGDRHGWQSREQSADNSTDRSDRADRRANRENRNAERQQQQQQQPVVHVETYNGGNGGNGGNGNEARFHRGFVNRAGGGDQAVQPTGHDYAGAPDTVRDWRSDERRSRGPRVITPDQIPNHDRSEGLREQRRTMPNVFRNRVPIVSNVPHEGTQPPLRLQNRSRDNNHRWNTSWRNDHRYNWNDWRRQPRSIFHLGFYYDPFGWGYQPYQIGWRLWPSYYSSRYWINDPWEYRLPYAPPGYRWIRYWDDAILVDTFTGEAVDVIHNFFW